MNAAMNLRRACLVLGTLVTGCGADDLVQSRARPDTTAPVVPPTPVAIAAVTITDKTLAMLSIGQTASVTAVVTDAHNVARTDRPVTWKSSDSSIATVTPTGAATAQLNASKNGTVTITVSVDGKSDNLRLQVWSEQAFIYSVATGITPIPLPDGVATSHASGINDLGQVVGVMTRSNGSRHAFLWSDADGTIDLGGFAGVNASSGAGCTATAINAGGEVTGWCVRLDYKYEAFLWSKATGMTGLGIFPGAMHSLGHAINNKGDIVGHLVLGNELRPFLWTRAAGMQLLGSLDDLPALATGINDAGLIVGTQTPRGDPYGFEYFDGVMWTGSGTLLSVTGCQPGGDCSASAINRAGAVTGHNYQGAAYTWTQSAGMSATGVSPAEGVAINDVGQIVGNTYGSNRGAFIWMPATGRIDIGVLPRRAMSYATGINNKGQVVGYSQ